MNQDELYEFEDQDLDIRQKEELVKEAQNVEDTSDYRSLQREINDLKRRWRQIKYWESGYEDELRDRFEAAIDVLYDKCRVFTDKNKEVKEAIVEKAQALSESENWKEATEKFSELMDQWKASGSAGRDTDDALWEKFNGARQKFYDRKHEHWEQLNERFANAKTVKEDLIVKAQAIQDSEEWQKASTQFKDLMTEWKKVGSAGREFEDQLWEKFNTARQAFYQRRNAYYEVLHQQQDQRYAQKQELVQRAQAILDSNDFSRENTQTMKDFSTEWKQIGSCGKEKEDEVWASFRAVMDKYFEGLKAFNDQKHQAWLDRMAEVRSRKEELIESQQRQIRNLENQMDGLVSEAYVEDLKDQIADKEEFIQQLEEEIADINAKIEQ